MVAIFAIAAMRRASRHGAEQPSCNHAWRTPQPIGFKTALEASRPPQWAQRSGRRVRRKVRSRSSARRMSNAARGRDAADVALTTAFGPTPLQRFEVTTYEEATAA
jgi:hypothetical protein